MRCGLRIARFQANENITAFSRTSKIKGFNGGSAENKN